MKFVNVYKFLMQIHDLNKSGRPKKWFGNMVNSEDIELSCVVTFWKQCQISTFFLVLMRMSLYTVHEQEIAVALSDIS